MKVGIVFGTFAPMHLGHLDVIKIAQEENDKVVVVCCGHKRDRGYPMFPLEKRYELACKTFEHNPAISVGLLPDTEPGAKIGFTPQQVWNYWLLRLQVMLYQNNLIQAGDRLCLYTSEKEYAHRICGFNDSASQKIKVRLGQRNRPISATAIRSDPRAHVADMLPFFARHYIQYLDQLESSSSVYRSATDHCYD